MEELTRHTLEAEIAARPAAPRRPRSRFARQLPIGTCVIVCLLLGAAAAAHGQVAAMVLACWVAGLAVGGAWLLTRTRAPRNVSLTIADLTLDGTVQGSRTLAVVPSRTAANVLRNRPRG